MLKISNLSFAYKKNNNVLNDINLSLKNKSIGVVLGKNGSGKSTLFKNILGILKPNQGDIKLNDLADVITKKLDVLIEQFDKTIKEFCTNNEQYPVVLTGGTSNLNNIKNYMSDALDLDVVDYPLLTIGARKFELINTLGLIKYWAIQPVINEDEVVTTTVSRVNQKPTRGYKFDEEL